MSNSSDIDTSIASLYSAWRLFRKGKRQSKAIDTFEYNLEAELLGLYRDLEENSYAHGSYRHFVVNDTKRRDIAVAAVRDRVMHRMIYEYLVPIVDKRFAYHVWSCRQNKGLLGAIIATGRNMQAYRNGWLWRGDVRKFFDSVDHEILLNIIHDRVPGACAYVLCGEVTRSYSTSEGRGIAIGNLTSQIFGNMYLNEFDRFVLHTIKPLAYVRYGDDFILWHNTKVQAVSSAQLGEAFLGEQLKLQMQPANTFIQRADKKLHFLGIEFFSFGRRLDARNTQKLTRRLNIQNQASYRALVLYHMPKRYRRTFAWECLKYYDTHSDID